MPGKLLKEGVIVAIADAHLDGLNTELDNFLSFLATLRARKIRKLFILGDLFTIWVGTAKLLLPYQESVVTALQDLRHHHIEIKYVEGNRDYFLAPLYLNTPFHEIASEYIREIIGNKQVYFSHGDLVNVRDRQYRLWRKFSRNRRLFSAFNVLPRVVAVRLTHALEQKFRETNQRHKSYFPADTCRQYVEELSKKGIDIIVVGHFHEAHHHTFFVQGKPKELYVLPAWRDSSSYLEITNQGEISFRHFPLSPKATNSPPGRG
jgi:UDP-2,3-diacylglucosamine hydrolase